MRQYALQVFTYIISFSYFTHRVLKEFTWRIHIRISPHFPIGFGGVFTQGSPHIFPTGFLEEVSIHQFRDNGGYKDQIDQGGVLRSKMQMIN